MPPFSGSTNRFKCKWGTAFQNYGYVYLPVTFLSVECLSSLGLSMSGRQPCPKYIGQDNRNNIVSIGAFCLNIMHVLLLPTKESVNQIEINIA